MKGKNFYYVRVSTKEQNISRQIDYIKDLNIQIDERDIFIDKTSGKNFDREQYKLLKLILRPGDCLYVKSIDRFGRNYHQILNEWHDITNSGVDIVILDMPLLDTRTHKDILGTLISDLVLQLLSYVATTELNHIKSRQSEGIKSAKANGVQFGRPRKEIIFDDSFKLLYRQWKKKQITTKYFKGTLGLKSNTFYRRIKEFENTNNK